MVRFAALTLAVQLTLPTVASAQTLFEGTQSAPSHDETTPAGGAGIEQPDDPNATRLLLGPTARSLRRGEAYLDLLGVSVPLVQVGLTERLSLGVGTPVLFPGVHPGEVSWFTPKLQLFSTDRTAAAIGVVHTELGNHTRDGLAYAVLTRGSSDTAVTLGVGYAYARSEDRRGGAPVLIVGAERRLGSPLKLITENYVAPGFSIVTVGVRLIRARVSWDFGLGADLGLPTVLTWPMIRFAWRFSEPKRTAATP
jgi:hypothetical protein